MPPRAAAAPLCRLRCCFAVTRHTLLLAADAFDAARTRRHADGATLIDGERRIAGRRGAVAAICR